MKKNVKQTVNELKTYFINIWNATSYNIPSLKETYTFKQKRCNERHMKKTIDEITVFLRKETYDENWKQNASFFISDKAKKILNSNNTKIRDMFIDKVLTVTNQFIIDVKNLDEDIKFEDIFQALRNVWIMNCLQVILNVTVKYTPSIFAYSMLYPYTDNFLDNPNISIEEKKKSNQRFMKKILGDNTQAHNPYEEITYTLIDTIVSQYPRKNYKHIYQSLVCINDGQTKSVHQQCKDGSCDNKEILDISFEKGATSVLSDAFLVKGSLSPTEIEFAFGFGIILQLIDDLQDIKTDLENNHMTIFSSNPFKHNLERQTCRLLTFMFNFFNNSQYHTSKDAKDFILFVEKYSLILIFQAIAKNQDLFHNIFLKDIQKYSEHRFKYLNKLNPYFKKRYRSINIDELWRK